MRFPKTEQYQGHEYILVGWDELTQFTLEQWELMSARSRCRVLRPRGWVKIADVISVKEDCE
jgi:hypothetical protein